MQSGLELAHRTEVDGQHVARCLRLIWQDEDTRKFIQVGVLWELATPAYAFEYTDGAQHERFVPLPEFPDRQKLYVTPQLPAFFANRVMSSRRESYGDYVGWLGIADVPTPVEILARSGGGRSTDTFHVVEGFVPVNGQVSGRFFASGIRHLPGAQDRLEQLMPGDFLRLRQEPGNSVNSKAVLLDKDPGQPVGYVPDWLLADLYHLGLDHVGVRVERVNRDAPAHLRLLCGLSGEVPADQ